MKKYIILYILAVILGFFLIYELVIKEDLQKKYKTDSESWVVDTICKDGKYNISIMHNLTKTNLGVKLLDTIEPTYHIKDTIQF